MYDVVKNPLNLFYRFMGHAQTHKIRVYHAKTYEKKLYKRTTSICMHSLSLTLLHLHTYICT